MKKAKPLIISAICLFAIATVLGISIALIYALEHRHSLTHRAAIEPTCTEDGKAEHWYCEGCGKYFLDSRGEKQTFSVTVPATGHHFSSVFVGDSEGHWHEADCGHRATTEKEAHVWDNGEITLPATCTETGLREFVCVECKRKREEDMPALGHRYSDEWSSDENAHWHNSDCGHEVATQKQPHVWDEGAVTLDPTCTETGIKLYTCTQCKREREEVLPPSGHSYSDEWSSDESTHWHRADCGHYLTTDVAPHFWDEGIVVLEPTCTEVGVKLYTCTVCERERKEEISASGHSYPDEGVITLYPTCTEVGVRVYYCTQCESTREEALPAMGHRFSNEWSSDESYHWHRAVCGHNLTKDVAPHEWDDGTVALSPNCTEVGIYLYTCTECGSTRDEEIPAVGHSWHDGVCDICGATEWDTEGLEFTKNEDEISYSVSGMGTAMDTDIFIPRVHRGLPVTAVAAAAFAMSEDITSVFIPDSVERISSSAFARCTNLSSVTLPDSLSFIGISAFEHCEKITSMELPQSVTHIGASAFAYCEALTEINLPSGITEIADSAFYVCRKLNDFEIPTSVKSIGSYAFYMCSALVNMSLPSGITEIADSTFGNCGKLKNIEIPNSVKSIGRQAFFQCSALSGIEFPEALETIGFEAFRYCTALSSLSIPASVSNIDNSALIGCSALESITVAEGNARYHSSGNCLIETLSKTLVAGCFGSIIPTDGSVTSIGDNAFYNRINLTELTIPQGIESIGKNAFIFCSGLKNLEIPLSVTSIGTDAFYSCYGLESITVAEGNTYYSGGGNCLIESSSGTLLLGCRSSVIPSDGSVTSIAEYAFYKCDIVGVVIPESVTSIGRYSFANCRELESVSLNSGLKSIGVSAFYYCTKLKSTTLPSTLTSIGACAFEDCIALENIIIPRSVETMGNNVFCDCENLIIYCEAETKPSGWNDDWNSANRPVEWGYTPKND